MRRIILIYGNDLENYSSELLRSTNYDVYDVENLS